MITYNKTIEIIYSIIIFLFGIGIIIFRDNLTTMEASIATILVMGGIYNLTIIFFYTPQVEYIKSLELNNKSKDEEHIKSVIKFTIINSSATLSHHTTSLDSDVEYIYSKFIKFINHD